MLIKAYKYYSLSIRFNLFLALKFFIIELLRGSTSNTDKTTESTQVKSPIKSNSPKSESEMLWSVKPVLLGAVKKEVSDESVGPEGYKTRSQSLSKSYADTSSFGISSDYPTSPNTTSTKGKKSENVDPKEPKSRNGTNVSIGIKLSFYLNYPFRKKSSRYYCL